MKPRTTLLLLLVAAGLFAFIKFYDSKQLGTRETAERNQYVVNFDSDTVTGIDIANKEERIELRKHGSDWFLERPVTDRADSAAVDQLLQSIQYLHRDTALDEKSAGGLKDFGLSNSQLRVRVICPGGPPEILLGNDSAVDGKTYLGIDRSSTVYVVDSSIKAQLSKSADDFRDHRLTTMDGSQVDKISIRTPAGEIDAAKSQGHWQISKPISARGDDQKIDDLVAQVVNARIDAFVPGHAPNAVPYGLEEPALSVTLSTSGGGKPETLDLGAANHLSGVFARIASRNGIDILPSKLKEALTVKPNDLRDKHLLRVNFDIVDRINIEPAGAPKIVLARKEESWIIKSLNDHPANAGAVKDLIAALQNTTAVSFVSDVSSDLAKYGLDAPRLKLTLSSYSSENTPETTAGERPIVTADFGKDDGGNVYARLEDEPFIISVPKTLLDSISTSSSQWQDLTVLKLNPGDITSIDIVRPNQPETAVTRGKDGAWKVTKGESPANDTNIQSFCNTFAALRAVRWLASPPPIAPADQYLLITTTAGNNTLKLTIAKEDNDRMSNATAAGIDGTFVLSKPDVDTLDLDLAAKPAELPPLSTPAPSPQPSAPAATPTLSGS